ncbi:cytochrome c oxidase subunit 8B [Nothobranchius furzeri]|uniref:Mitochondrial n=1 Tax=Nothobranchius furzeri TaxID=105023 RepID=A0A1A7ZHJ1_NOTFU|nr:cytochrome c oxidase subunit 8B, mitochondrial [Nothobranchius furzeri]KAF7215141.1 mitochondrial [Nothobranchius furzeri]
MSLLPTASRLFKSALKTRLVPVANVTFKPAKEVLSAGEQVIAMTTLFVTILGPSGWILAHLEDYKHKKE